MPELDPMKSPGRRHGSRNRKQKKYATPGGHTASGIHRDVISVMPITREPAYPLISRLHRVGPAGKHEAPEGSGDADVQGADRWCVGRYFLARV